MTAGSNIIKKLAKSALKDNFLKSVIVSLIVIFFYWINVYLTSLISIFAGDLIAILISYCILVLLFLPLGFGVLRFFWRMVSLCDDKPISVFYYFSEFSLYFKTLRLLLSIFLKLLPIAAVLYLPVIFIWSLSQNYFFEFFDMAIPLWTRNLNYAILFSKTITNVALIMFALRYYLAPFLFIADENIDVSEAVHISTIISKKTTLDFIFLAFSFIGWIILSLFVMPLPFTLPYIITAYLVHSKLAAEEYNNHIESLTEKSYPSFSVGI